jgi:hypothetical protein
MPILPVPLLARSCHLFSSRAQPLVQIAGAYYGVDAIDRVWLRDLRRWDPEREIELRALLLFFAGTLCDPPSTSTGAVVSGEVKGEQHEQEQSSSHVNYHNFFPEGDVKAVVGPNHPDYVPRPTPSKSFEPPSSSSKRTFSMFSLFT